MDLQSLLNSIYEELRERIGSGEVADYIPELAKVDKNQFGIAVATTDGAIYSVGDSAVPFSIQSISKVFTLTLALGRYGNSVWKRVGREPSGSAFNSIVQLEFEKGRPRNPFINAGAIVISDLILAGHKPREAIGEIVDFMRYLAQDESIIVDRDVAESELRTGHRNLALASFMKSFANLDHDAKHVLGVYFHQCAIAMSCEQLAYAGLFLANGGKNTARGLRVVSAERARRINALMMMCGHYDASGDFAYRVGMPGKSGVGGGILAIAPEKASIAVWSPGLDSYGNSVLGSAALELLAHRTGWSVFGA